MPASSNVADLNGESYDSEAAAIAASSQVAAIAPANPVLPTGAIVDTATTLPTIPTSPTFTPGPLANLPTGLALSDTAQPPSPLAISPVSTGTSLFPTDSVTATSFITPASSNFGEVTSNGATTASLLASAGPSSATLGSTTAGFDMAPSLSAAQDASSPTAAVSPYPGAALPQRGTNPGQVRSAPSANNNSSSTVDMFFAAKGTYYVVQYPTNSGKGIYAVEGLNRFTESDAMDDAATARTRAQQNDAFADQMSDAQDDFDASVDQGATDSATYQALQAPTSSNAADLYGESYDSEAAAQAQGLKASGASAEASAAYHAADVQNALDAQQGISDIQEQQQAYAQQNKTEDAATAAVRADRQKVPVLIMGTEVTRADVVSAMACLGNLKVLYAMGQTFGDMKIVGNVLLGPLGNGAVDGVGILNKFFNKYRVSISRASITVSIATQAYEFFLASMVIGDIDHEQHILPFVLGGIVVDPSNGDLFSINPAYTIDTTLTNPNAVQTIAATSAGQAAATSMFLADSTTAALISSAGTGALDNGAAGFSLAPSLTPGASGNAGNAGNAANASSYLNAQQQSNAAVQAMAPSASAAALQNSLTGSNVNIPSSSNSQVTSFAPTAPAASSLPASAYAPQAQAEQSPEYAAASFTRAAPDLSAASAYAPQAQAEQSPEYAASSIATANPFSPPSNAVSKVAAPTFHEVSVPSSSFTGAAVPSQQ